MSEWFLNHKNIQNSHCAVDLRQVAGWHHLWWLIANTNLKTGRTPIHELDSALGFQAGHGCMHFLWYNISTIEQAGCHVLSIARIALHHLVGRLETRHRYLLDRVCFVTRLGRGNNRGVCNKREVDTWIRHKVGLELIEIDVERAIKSEGGSDRRYHCSQSISMHGYK